MFADDDVCCCVWSRGECELNRSASNDDNGVVAYLETDAECCCSFLFYATERRERRKNGGWGEHGK
jgi:hypothetical protein